LWWRLRAELGLAPLGRPWSAVRRGGGFLLLALGMYIVTDSVRVLVTGSRPESSLIGIVLMAISLVVMRSSPRKASRCGQPWKPGIASGRARDDRLRLALGNNAARSGLERRPRLVVATRRCVGDAAADRAEDWSVARGSWRKLGR